MEERIRRVAPCVQEAAQRLRQDSTQAECTLWDALRNRQITGCKFRRQHPIHKFILDFCAPSHRLIIELDGSSHIGKEEHDKERDGLLAATGWRTLRFTNTEVLEDLDSVLEAVRAAILERLA